MMANSSTMSFATPSSNSQICPRLFIQMSGAPGSGKSTTAELLAKEINAYIVPHDVIKTALLEDHIPFDNAGKVAYSVDWAIAEEMIKQERSVSERSVIIDSTCNFQETVNRGKDIAQKYGYTYWYIEIRADADNLDLLNKRLQCRAPLRAQRPSVDGCPPDATQDPRIQSDARERFKNWILYPCRPDNNVIIVDSESKFEERVQQILAQFSSRGIHSTSLPFEAFSGPHLPPNTPTATEEPFLFSHELISPKVQSELPEDYSIRPLCRSDYRRGYPETLRELTEVGDFTREQFEHQFDLMMQRKDTYYIIVIEDKRTGRVVATGSVIVELKFIHGLGKAAHLEDLVVARSHRGKHLGLHIHKARDYIIQQSGCYKSVLDCRDYNVGFHEKAGYTHTGAYMKKRYDGVPVGAYGTMRPGT